MSTPGLFGQDPDNMVTEIVPGILTFFDGYYDPLAGRQSPPARPLEADTVSIYSERQWREARRLPLVRRWERGNSLRRVCAGALGGLLAEVAR